MKKKLKLKRYFVTATPETLYLFAYGKAEAREEAFQHFQACYGNKFKIKKIEEILPNL